MKVQKYLTIGLCGLFVLFFSLWCFFVATPEYSESERRQLASFPEVTWESIRSGEFAREFESYTTDRFPLRDSWRRIKSYVRFYVFQQEENNDLFLKDGHISKLEYPMNPPMLDYAASLFTKIRQQHFPENNVYFSVIPDKNRYLAELKLDYGAMESYMEQKMEDCTFIPLAQLLEAEDYYYTDSHWRQERIVDVAGHLAKSMGTELSGTYQTKTLDLPFYGVYAGQSALHCKPDTINYLTNETIAGLRVTGAQGVYDLKKADSRDPYEFFLSGNQPLVKISNPQKPEGKKLVVFRDSFASSLMPLLAEGYSEITMVDLRYINSALLSQYVDFSEADVLFLYSVGLLNNSISMK